MIQAVRTQYFLIAGHDAGHFYRGTENCKAGGIVGRYAAKVYAVRSAASRRRCCVCDRLCDVAFAICNK